MTERLDSQIILDSTEVFIPSKELSLKKKGRRPIIISEKWLDAVKKIQTMNDKEIAKELGVNRITVWRFRNNVKNVDIVKEGIKFLKRLAEIGYDRKLDNWEIFKRIPIIEDWSKILLERRRVSKGIHDYYIKTFFNVCKYLKIHPSKIDVETCAKLNNEHKKLYWENREKEIPRGLAYNSLRESLRSFFILMHNYSGEYLSSLGITKETLKGAGKFSKQRVSKKVRHRFEIELMNHAKNENEYL